MNRTWCTALVIASCFVVHTQRQATASLTWPTSAQWVALPDPCDPSSVYTEPHDDFPGAPGHHDLDIVGNATHPAGFRYTDGTNLFFRMRVDKADSTLPQSVWQFLLDTDKDANGYVNYSLQLDNKVDDAVEFVPATPGGPLFAQVNLSHNANDGHWSGNLATYSQITVDTGDTNLGGNSNAEKPNDTWIDVAMPWVDFTAKTGIANDANAFYGWRVYLTTSDSHIQVNKDTPECAGSPAVPEPSTFIIWGLLGVVGLAAAWRRRTRKAT